MTDEHPSTPPLELKQQWEEDWLDLEVKHKEFGPYMAECGAQWGADQELEACRMEIIDGAGLFLIGDTNHRLELANDLHDARRPKPPSLKEQALLRLDALDAELRLEGKSVDLSQIRYAVEALPGD